MIAVGVLAGIAVLAIAGFGVFVWLANDVERPDYASVTRDGAFEVRDYPALVVAEVTRTGDRWKAVNKGFRPLAAYIFAKERAGESIAMTAPVTQQRREAIAMTAPVTQTPDEPGTDAWTVRFIMPAHYALEDLPRPANDDVRLADVPAQRRAAIRFSGVATDILLAEKGSALRAWMNERGLKPLGPPTYAYYNAPFTPGFLRRNEVMFEVAGG
ncbi:MAG: heme-binding protein [Alphaproteobacteria bacterium]|nr:heme-binding protein [Alphaproteobacteria bacterium]